MMTGFSITLRHCKSTLSSTFKEWVHVLSSMTSYERVTYRVTVREDLLNKVWDPFLAQLSVMQIFYLDEVLDMYKKNFKGKFVLFFVIFLSFGRLVL